MWEAIYNCPNCNLWRVRRRKLRNAQQNDEELNLESYFLRYSTEPNGGWSGNLPWGGDEWQILHRWVKNGQLWCWFSVSQFEPPFLKFYASKVKASLLKLDNLSDSSEIFLEEENIRYKTTRFPPAQQRKEIIKLKSLEVCTNGLVLGSSLIWF